QAPDDLSGGCHLGLLHEDARGGNPSQRKFSYGALEEFPFDLHSDTRLLQGDPKCVGLRQVARPIDLNEFRFVICHRGEPPMAKEAYVSQVASGSVKTTHRFCKTLF